MSGPDLLVLRALGLGDFVTGLPALRLLRDACPEHRIVLAAPRPLAPLVTLAGVVDAQVHAHELEPIDAGPDRPELAVDLHGNGPASRDLLTACHPRHVLAYADGRVRWRAEEHEVERWCRLLREGLPMPVGATPPLAGLLPVPDTTTPEGLSVVHCGAKAPSRRWPAARFVALARLLAGRGHQVVITGGQAEAALATSVAQAADVRALVQPSVPYLAGLVARARLVISGDTGIAHLASVYRTPSVVLFGPVSPSRWGPPDDPRHQVIWHGDGSGDPHGQDLDPALERITVAEVGCAVDRALREADMPSRR